MPSLQWRGRAVWRRGDNGRAGSGGSAQPAKKGPLWAVGLRQPRAGPGWPHRIKDQGHGARLPGLLLRKCFPFQTQARGPSGLHVFIINYVVLIVNFTVQIPSYL